jgi:hypothetical protein
MRMVRNRIDFLQIILILIRQASGCCRLNLEKGCSSTDVEFLALPPRRGTGAAQPARAEAPVTVVATTGMIADAARVVGGDLVEVQALMGPGVDPHAYRQTRTDIVAMTRADLVLWHGLYLEAQMEEFLTDLAARQPVVAVGEAVPGEARWPTTITPTASTRMSGWTRRSGPIVDGGVADALVGASRGRGYLPRERRRASGRSGTACGLFGRGAGRRAGGRAGAGDGA